MTFEARAQSEGDGLSAEAIERYFLGLIY